jgi:hypothetical protein
VFRHEWISFLRNEKRSSHGASRARVLWRVAAAGLVVQSCTADRESGPA